MSLVHKILSVYWLADKIQEEAAGGDEEDDEEKEFPPLTKERRAEAKKFEMQLSNKFSNFDITPRNNETRW